jgi:hypothetical protein
MEIPARSITRSAPMWATPLAPPPLSTTATFLRGASRICAESESRVEAVARVSNMGREVFEGLAEAVEGTKTEAAIAAVRRICSNFFIFRGEDTKNLPITTSKKGWGVKKLSHKNPPYHVSKSCRDNYINKHKKYLYKYIFIVDLIYIKNFFDEFLFFCKTTDFFLPHTITLKLF